VLPGDVDAASLPVPVMRTVFIAESRAEADRALAAQARESRVPSGRKLPRALARAAAAPPEQRVVIGEAGDVVERLARYREQIGLDLLIVRPQVAGIDEKARRRSFDRIVEEVWPALAATAKTTVARVGTGA
jgi:alkanesulfonate monooxygenase SsuD/methylene tetrahydromethanopterin reductase-like flavin-dependent oxidoreductase (luciferase family)